jgi:hypothetical protein
MKGVININALNLTKLYLTWPEEKRRETCRKIIELSLKSMTVPALKEQRIKTMRDILDNSIKEYEKIEYYEEAQILFEVKKELETI